MPQENEGLPLERSSTFLDELSCPVCLRIYRLPITTRCGHTFCKYCITHRDFKSQSCPICRQDIGNSFTTNTVLQNLVLKVNSLRQDSSDFQSDAFGTRLANILKVCEDQKQRVGNLNVAVASSGLENSVTSVHVGNDGDSEDRNKMEHQEACVIASPETPCSSETIPFEKGLNANHQFVLPSTFDTIWWNRNFAKPQVNVRLFLTILLKELNIDQSLTFLDDLTSLFVNFSTKHNLWTFRNWMCTLWEANAFCYLLNLQKSASNEESLVSWVEATVSRIPSLIAAKETPPYIFKITNSRFDKNQVMENRLPWDLGRHSDSVICVPHDSISQSHLLFVETNDGFGVMDCGSSFGTHIMVDSPYVLKEGDIMHLGTRIELKVLFERIPQNMTPSNYEISLTAANELGPSVKAGSFSAPNQQLKLCLLKNEDVVVEVPPGGIILGRKPHCSTSALKKFTIPTVDPFLSRNHCSIHYESQTQKWILHNLSSRASTFIRLHPFSQPIPVSHGISLKIGQCILTALSTSAQIEKKIVATVTFPVSQLAANYYHSRSEQNGQSRRNRRSSATTTPSETPLDLTNDLLILFRGQQRPRYASL